MREAGLKQPLRAGQPLRRSGMVGLQCGAQQRGLLRAALWPLLRSLGSRR